MKFVEEILKLKKELTYKAVMDESSIDIFKQKIKDAFQATRFVSNSYIKIAFDDIELIYGNADTIILPYKYEEFVHIWLKDNGFIVHNDSDVVNGPNYIERKNILKVTID